jgi:DNA-binding beta-propeller fold protein YncE
VNGEVDALETTNTVDARIPVGICPVYGVESGDLKRLFVLNRGSDTVSVIDVQRDTLNTCASHTDPNTGRTVTCHSTLPLSLTAVNALNAISPGSGNPPNGTAGMTATAGPVYAEYNAATNQLVVADYDGNTISIIDVSLDEYGNDSATFGTTYTVPVGKNPASVTVLVDGSRAYTANQADSTVSIVNLASHTLQTVAPLPVEGHPRTVVSSQNSSYGKVYVASPDSPQVTIINTGGPSPDTIDTTVLVEGNVVDVRVQYQNATSGNTNTMSRVPGFGQPCNLSPADMIAKYGANYTLAECANQP